ncbi:MAG: hypothetical protein RLW87_21015 [Alphaproteobacteria bacterium]|jgi:hypothetical protein|uniref:hypothetical protein n=1 Tax=Pacificispira sp. TaxID=2888761 RepID=UPI002968B0A8|nr:hypothetical protein [Alphaproteobacteria bacterium]
MNNAPTEMGMSGQMMDCMGGMMMWGMGLVGLLVVALLVLGIAGLIKYLFVDARRRNDHG